MRTQETKTNPSYLRAREVTSRFQISRATLDRLVRVGEFPPPIKLGRVNRWGRAVVDRWERERQEAAATGPVGSPAAVSKGRIRAST